MTPGPVVEAHGLSKVYELGLSGRRESLLKTLERRVRHPVRGRAEPRRTLVALDDVSFDVQRGEAVGVIGRNGAGKSTLLKILSRITPPSDGYIDLVGSVGSLLEVGTGFHPELTGIENVYLNGAVLGMPPAEVTRRLDEIVAFSEVDNFLDTPVKRYSSGMRVRLAFAVAAHLDPDVLIVDEVLSVGDAGFQRKCMTKMQSVASHEGRTVLYVSHNLVTLENLCERSLLLDRGQLVFDGPTGDAIARYSVEGVFDLAGADRSGSGLQHLFHRISLRPDGGEPANVVRMGQRLHVDLDVEGFADVPTGSHLVMTIVSSTDQPVIVLTSGMVALEAAGPRRPRETVAVVTGPLPLTPGEYSVHVAVVGVRGRSLDHVREAASFSVEPADVLGTGYRYEATNHGLVAVPWTWEIRPGPDPDGFGAGSAGDPVTAARTPVGPGPVASAP
jgi:lipopolysaccharide transport system ATP-binding protein